MALRRQVRMRKEYMYRKALTGKEASIYEDKRRVREALRDGTPLPTELRADEATLRHEVSHVSSDYHMSRSRAAACRLSRTPKRDNSVTRSIYEYWFAKWSEMSRVLMST